MPERIINKPILLPGLELYYIMFFDLIHDRDIGFSVGYIKWQTIENYANSNGFSYSQKLSAHRLIPKMDEVFLSKGQK